MKGISVIVCCYNSVKLLEPTVQHLSKQVVSVGTPWEIIIVDNASTDNTAAFVQSIWDATGSSVPFNVIFEPNAGLANARIRGINEAKYDYLVFCDDDNWLEENYIENSFRILSGNDNIGICGGTGEPVYETFRPEWLSDLTLQMGYAVGPQVADIPEGPVANNRPYIYGAGMVVRKQLVQQVYAEFNHSDMLLSGRKGNVLAAGDDSAISFFVIMKGYQLWYSSKLKFKHYLTDRRLKKEYTTRMFQGFGVAAAHLKLYHSFFPNATALKRQLYSYWITQLLVQVSVLAKTWFFFADKQTKPFVIQMEWYTLKEILRNRKALSVKKLLLSEFYLK
ncbi:glycosyltransferase [Mucilaginibacter sp.]|uniref:glycosyltransferase n=1 Tax=Mucilaginibacter sp. TaxID=1882438 RepID=UPI002ED683FC